MTATMEAYPCQGNDDCIRQLPETTPLCECCGLPACEAHSILVNGLRYCEIGITTHFPAKGTV